MTFRLQGICRFLVPALLFFFFAPDNFSLFSSNSSDHQTSLAKHLHVVEAAVYAKDMPIVDQTEWYIRLSITMPAVDLTDSNNSLGIHPESSFGRDLLDIPDQPRPPWIENYLDLVFPHPEWGGELTDFSSDFRIADAEKSTIESWLFEVRSNILHQEAIFSWHGPAHILSRCRLRDGVSGKLLVSEPLQDGYTFTMTAPVHVFIWEYGY